MLAPREKGIDDTERSSCFSAVGNYMVYSESGENYSAKHLDGSETALDRSRTERGEEKEKKKRVGKTALFDCMTIKLRQFSSGEECDKRWR